MNKSLSLKIKGISYTLRLIGAGGTAYLYKGLPSAPTQPPITVKILKRRHLSSVHICKRFRQELINLRAMQHHAVGIPGFIHFGKILGRPYYVYRHIDGENLLYYAKQNPTNNHNKIALIIVQLLSHLTLLHENKPPIVHGDLSPENIIFHKNEVTIIDFGSAQKLNKKGNISDSRWVGKPSYMSPEQAQGRHWDERSDLYQVGILFYELLTQEKYIRGKNISETKTIASNPGRLNFQNIPHAYRAVIEKLLETLPEERFPSATETLIALKKAIELQQQRETSNDRAAYLHT